ncbi:MAG: glycosyltransferase [Buchnera aphidicola (Schlechtendalia peitan)]
MNKKTIIIMAGGTCGHIFPGLIIANTLIARGWRVFWLGTPDRMESIIIPNTKISIKYIHIHAIKKKLFWFNKVFFSNATCLLSS